MPPTGTAKFGGEYCRYSFQYTHPDAEGWQKRLMAYIGYLQDL
jgi:hypothetical protein